MSRASVLLGPMRLPFLILTPSCVFLGLGTAIWTSGHVNTLHVILAFIGAVCAHISVNALNEYYDFKSKLDYKTTRTPFSGGSGTLPANPEKAKQALYTGLIAALIIAAVGVFFISIRGYSILPLGLLGLLVIFSYTILLTKLPVASLVAPGLGFGTFMVMGTHYVLTGEWSTSAFMASLVPFFLVSNLLLLNQFPDIEADKSVDRKNLPIVAGTRSSAIIFGVFLLLAYLSIIIGVWLNQLPVLSLLGLITSILAVPTAIGAIKHGDNIEKLTPYLGLNVIINITTPALVAVGLLLA